MTSRPADWRSILADPKDHTRLIWKKAFGNTLTAGFTFEEGLEMMAGKKACPPAA